MDHDSGSASKARTGGHRSERPIPILRRQSVLWRHLDEPGMQLARISDIADGHIIDGRVLTALDGQPTEVHYAIMCGADWTTHHAFATVLQGTSTRAIQLRRDEEGRWWATRDAHVRNDPAGDRIPGLDGVHDVDLAISPVTNTLPIRRLGLAVGDSRDTDAAWVGFPDLAVERLPQRYTRESPDVYRYESNGGAFMATLQVDEHGVIVRYGDLWERIASSAQEG